MPLMHNVSGPSDHGQTIVEIIVVVGVAVILVTALVASSTIALKSGQFGKMKSTAVQYAQEALEMTRNMRDKSWDDFYTYGDSLPSENWCLDKQGTWTPQVISCLVNIDSIYTRTVTFAWQDPQMKVDVVVSWADGAKAYNATLSTYFTQWR
ncbi:MAG: hypothetical protein UY10_C0017G0007 [Microgenomates group bacterium GW2011_GWA2_47_8]|nr:MAG: hypothetical protein UY10_C0017G0007 [Microgenomates group bacterium GW2011_GWA2_47_8]